MKPSEVLEQAKTVIEERGWCQGRYHDEEGRSCAIGAVMATTASPVESHRAVGYLRLVVKRGIPGWNDELGRAKWQVIHAFNTAIAVAKERGE